MNLLRSYTLLAASLGGIFAAGWAVGYFAGKRASPSALATEQMIGTSPGTSPEQWAGQAFDSLAGDLKLTEAQRAKVRPYLEATAERVFVERDRALLQIHLRLLEVHDTLTREAFLDEAQKKHLAQSRAKLKASILGRFARLLRTEDGLLPDI